MTTKELNLTPSTHKIFQTQVEEIVEHEPPILWLDDRTSLGKALQVADCIPVLNVQ